MDGSERSSSAVVGGAGYTCHVVRTRWFTPEDDLQEALAQSLPPLLLGDTIVVSEKAAVFMTGRAVPIADLRPSRLTLLLAGHVHPRPNSRGLSVPEKMQYVVATLGWARIVAAALAGALTRPLGIRGAFYRVAGSAARDVDGGRPPYEHLIMPPIPKAEAEILCAELEQELGAGVAIVDMNDYGGTVRAVSPRALPARTLRKILAANPLGQRTSSTPFGIVRRTRVADDLDSAGAPEQARDAS